MNKNKKWNIAIIGATGTVGEEMLSILEEREFPVKELFLYASQNSAGTRLSFNGKYFTSQVLSENNIEDFKKIDVALMSAGSEISRHYAPLIAKQGTVLVDNSNAWRMDSNVPLIVPEVNYTDIMHFKKTNIIANPNCSTIQMVLVLKPIHDAFRIRRIVVSTYQSVSGKGKKGIQELANQMVALLNQKEIEFSEFPHQIAFNCIPHIDKFIENRYTLEEQKMVQETRKIMNDSTLRITATCVRVPVFSAHCESINIETERKATAQDIFSLLSQAKGLKIVDDPEKNSYPLNIHAAGKNETLVGRIREDESIENGINMWVVSDNIRKGAALNAVQISEALVTEFL